MTDATTAVLDLQVSRDEILSKLQNLLCEILNLESAEAIQPEARLQDDLHIDSLGMVDIIIGLEETFDVKIRSDVNIIEEVTTVDDAVDLIVELSQTKN